MYLRQQTWVENGPCAREIPVPVVAMKQSPKNGFVMPRRGVAAVGDQAWCDAASAWNPVAWFACFGRDVANVATGTTSADYLPPPALPAPAAPVLTTDPAAAGLPDAAYAGMDANGTPIYAVPETAAQNMDVYRASVAQFFNEQGQRTPPSATLAGWLLPAGIAAAVLGGLVLFGGSRGRR